MLRKTFSTLQTFYDSQNFSCVEKPLPNAAKRRVALTDRSIPVRLRSTKPENPHMQIGPNSVVSIHYELSNDAGEILDASAEGEPLVYLQGAQNIIPGLENQLTGKKAGDTLKVKVQPEDGYGVRQSELVQQVPRDAFPDPDNLTIGMRFSAESEGGHVSVVITELTDELATIDGNHPLAGVVLNFDVSVADVRAATDEELSHGHVHTHGHHH